ncbi:transmembrane protein 267 [Battus philenor]|uniref:transmembrane protein 267 n=1 Tax=Battus philenor TaxID=42288 RepID=UPI0035D088C0
MKLISVILTVLICCTALIGDFVVFKSKYSDSQVFRAISDSSTHAAIGLLSALLFFTYETGLSDQARLYNVMFCTALSSLIDIDHFIAAKSFKLKDLVHLKQRGILHCTTLWILLTAISLFLSHLTKRLNIYTLTFMAVLAYMSHHVRDANRRGLWLYPFGHTPPLSKYFYIFLLLVLPRVVANLYLYMKPAYRHTVLYYDSLV